MRTVRFFRQPYVPAGGKLQKNGGGFAGETSEWMKRMGGAAIGQSFDCRYDAQRMNLANAKW
jgi:hypothetical protein